MGYDLEHLERYPGHTAYELGDSATSAVLPGSIYYNPSVAFGGKRNKGVDCVDWCSGTPRGHYPSNGCHNPAYFPNNDGVASDEFSKQSDRLMYIKNGAKCPCPQDLQANPSLASDPTVISKCGTGTETTVPGQISPGGTPSTESGKGISPALMLLGVAVVAIVVLKK